MNAFVGIQVSGLYISAVAALQTLLFSKKEKKNNCYVLWVTLIMIHIAQVCIKFEKKDACMSKPTVLADTEMGNLSRTSSEKNSFVHCRSPFIFL